MKKVAHVACPLDCPDACGILVTIEDGRATKIKGDPEHPITRGFLCAKVTKYLDRVYSPDRLLYPMRRIAPKGQGGPQAFTRITWEEALDEICTRFQEVIAKFGPEAILPYSYGGTLGTVQGSCMDRRFFHRLGASQLDRTICSAAGEAGILSVYGRKLGTEPEQFAQARLIIAWGANIHGNNVHLWPFIEEARRNGAKLVVIDPYRTRTARAADLYLQINPGTDVTLALAMKHVINGEELYDRDYVASYTLGFEQLRRRVLEYPPERVAAITGIAADEICRLARAYALTRPAVIRLNYGAQRCQNGGMATRAICMLPCITGAWRYVGGGLQLSTSGAFELNKAALRHEEFMRQFHGRTSRLLNMNHLGHHLLDDLRPPVMALFVYNCNPAAVAPNRELVVRGLLREDLFTVVHEQFITDTTDYADLVLPATTFLEHEDLQTAYGHYFLQHSEQSIAALGEARSNSDLFRALAARMGFEEECFRQSDRQVMAEALNSPSPWLEDITLETLTAAHRQRLRFSPLGSEPFLPFAAGGFGTASGKAEVCSDGLELHGLDPVAAFVPPEESRHAPQARRYPLELLARKHDNFLNSSFCNLPGHRAMEKTGLLEMSAEDAAARGIQSGDHVRVRNDRGEVLLRAAVGPAVGRGVVAAHLDWARLSEDGKNANVLTSDRLSDLGGGATFYSTLVEVERA